VDIAQFLNALMCAPHVEVIEALLGGWPTSAGEE
jgi:hypothetical protein